MAKNYNLSDAIELHKSGNFQAADSIYSSILDAEPINVRVLALRGLAAQSLGSFNDAIRFFELAEKLQPNDTNILLQLAISLSQAGLIEISNQHYKKILKINPNNLESIVNYANNLTKLDKFLEAADLYKKAISIQPLSPKIYYNFGTMFLKQMDPDGALPWLKRATELDESSSSAWNSLGAVYAQIGSLNEAKIAFQKSIALDTHFVEPIFNIHSIYLDLGQSNLAIEALEKAIEVDKSSHTLKFFLGMAYEYFGFKSKGAKMLGSISQDNSVQAELSSWKFLKDECNTLPLLIGTDNRTFEIAVANSSLNGLNLEFGVYNGKSIRRLASILGDTIHGFDSFEGIPESWNDEPKGSYSTSGKLPEVPKNVELHQGWFDKTLPSFIEKHNSPIRILHIDCDLYSSTKIIFDILSEQIVSGTVIIFDEFIGYKSWQDDEFKAFMEAAIQYSWKYEFLSFSFVTKQVALKIR